MIDRWFIGFVCVVVVILVGAAFAPRRASTLRDRAERAAAKVGLALTDDVAPEVIRRQIRERRLSLILSAITWSGSFAVVQVIEGQRFDPAAIWFTNGSIVVGGAIGSAVAATIDSRRRLALDARRVARDRSVTLDDYVPRTEVIGTRAAAGAAIAVLAFAVLVGTLPLLAGTLIAGLCVAAIALFELGGRWIVRQRQRASTTTELAWDDAQRSGDLKAMELAAFTTALYAVLGSLFEVAELHGPVHVLADAGMMVLIAGLCVLAVVRARRSPDRDSHFLRRLWPETAAELTERERPPIVEATS